ncbi:hypothetical protein [Conexibacter woesei]|uniref:hypothetical protein n=1 Tax=Conexibacter woesei TaxID=191495 RepID=UPI0012DE5550|nr:hypothetical protein [Conexibacter woesei]
MAAPARPAAVAAPPPVAVDPRVLRKTLGAYLAGAIALAILVLLGTIGLGGKLTPWAVLVVDAIASVALFQWSQSRLSGLALSDEDRVMQTLAGGMLALVLVFAAVAAVVLTVA